MKPLRGKVERRGKEKRKRNPIVLYAVEGKNKTESLYLKNFNRRGRPQIIKADGNETDPVKMMGQLAKQAAKLGLSVRLGDKAYCIFDTDTDRLRQAQIDAALMKQTELLKVIASAPCVEEWFLCHFRYSTKYLTSDDAIDELKRYIPEYTKNSDIFKQIENKTEQAIERARHLEQFHDDQRRRKHSVDRNPSTDMYQVIEYIMGIS